MILSYEHRFAFLKVPKTAGSSVEVVLSQVAGPEAIVTPLYPHEAGHGPRNFRRPHLPLREMLGALGPPTSRPMGTPGRRTKALRQVLGFMLHREAFSTHMTLDQLRRRARDVDWSDTFTFCFVRNPWDLAVSQYGWTRRLRGAARVGDFDRFVRFSTEVRSSWGIYGGRSGVEVDFVGRYEHLERDFARALDRIGLHVAPPLPRAKGAARQPRDDLRWTRAASEHVRRVFAREIEEFGYEEPESVRAAISR